MSNNLIGILSTVILVSTLATLVFAVFAYAASRRRQTSSVSAQPHHREHPIPDVESAPELPREFMLRMHDVHQVQTPAAVDSKPKPTTAPEPPKRPAPPPSSSAPLAHKPVFRSLAEKKSAASRPAQEKDAEESLSDD